MRKIGYFILVLMMATVASGCSDSSNNVWNNLPTQVAEFIARYFPERGVSKYVNDDSDSHLVEIKDGPTILFGPQYQWISMNGNGETLPPMFLFDQLPPALYSWLQDNEAVDDVYRATREDGVYELTLESEIVSYNLTTGLITFPYQ